MATVIDLDQVKDGDSGLFTSTKVSGPNPYLPHVKASWHTRGEDGKGKAKAFPLPFGEIGGVTAIMRRAANETGCSLRFRWIATDQAAHEVLVKNVEAANAALEGFTAAPADAAGVPESDKNRTNVQKRGKSLTSKLDAAKEARDASAGMLHFQAVPRISKASATAASGDTAAAAPAA